MIKSILLLTCFFVLVALSFTPMHPDHMLQPILEQSAISAGQLISNDTSDDDYNIVKTYLIFSKPEPKALVPTAFEQTLLAQYGE